MYFQSRLCNAPSRYVIISSHYQKCCGGKTASEGDLGRPEWFSYMNIKQLDNLKETKKKVKQINIGPERSMEMYYKNSFVVDVVDFSKLVEGTHTIHLGNNEL